MTQSKSFVRTFVAVAACSLACWSAAQSVTLRLKLPVGKKLVYTNDTRMDIHMKMPKNQGGPTMPDDMGMTINQVTNVQVVSKSAKGYVTKMTIVEAKATADKGNPMGTMISGMAEQMKGSTVEATYDELGNIVGSLKTTTKSGATMQMGQTGDMKFGFMGLICPKNAVSVGSSWSQSIDFSKVMAGNQMARGMQIGGSMPLTYKLVKVANAGGKSIATVSVTLGGTMTIGGQSAAGASTMTAKISGGGTILVDVATGLPQTSTINLNMSMMAMGMPITQKMVMTQKLK